MGGYIILSGFCIIIFAVSFFIINHCYKEKEHKLMDTLQEMINAAAYGKISSISFDESKLSYLENSMRHYLLSQEMLMKKIHEQKETIQSMITDISHQSTTPISNILLYAELLEEQDSNSAEELSVIKEEARKLDFLIQSLVKAARLETGIITINTQNEDINSIFQAIKAQYYSSAKSKNIIFEIEPTSTRAEFDLKWTIEAISNIVDNAIKYTDSGGKITIQAIPYQMFVRIDIADTGIGISENEQNKIFLRFYRSLDVCEKSGVGIGLYLSREIIQMEKGYIKVESQKGVGSKFSIFLPM